MEPDGALKETRELFRRVRNGFRNANPQVFSEDLKRENPSDCYTTTALNLYATWLTSVKRYDETLEVYQKILHSGHNEYKVGIKMGVARCYLFLKKEEDARRILEELKPEYDEAFWLLRTLDKKQGIPVDPLIER